MVLRHAVAAFVRHPRVNGVLVAIRPEDRALFDDAVAGLPVLAPVAGGATRQDSVRFGLEALASHRPRYVLIHDGARPFPDSALIDRVIRALDEAPAAIPCLPLRDTIKRAENQVIRATVDRTELWRAQTPQGFHFDAILTAHRSAAGRELTDDSAVAEMAGLAPLLVAGSEDNLKVTTTEDLAAAERLIAARLGDVRVGQGFDAHAFGPGDRVYLCGVEIAHGAGLVGHSDADVGLHAITDALLGAIGAGDIGMHFPPSDPRWRSGQRSGRRHRRGRSDDHLRAAQDRPPSCGDGRADRGRPRHRRRPRQRQGDDDRSSRLYRPRRGHRRDGRRERAPAIVNIADVVSPSLRPSLRPRGEAGTRGSPDQVRGGG
jgi:2-C-methyl-D-erythritol 4-phosphate cytidylyltransferase / 2-C-methyl-D-erythritol 2,4-cyclodiphosphate synthase